MKKNTFTFFAMLLLPMMCMAMVSNIAAPNPEDDDESNWTDCTETLTNPSFENGKIGWTVNKGKIEVKGNGPHVVTAYNYQVDICQLVSGLEPGHYVIRVQACSRYMDGKAGIADYESRISHGEEIPNEAYLYANGVQKKVKNIFDEASTTLDFAKESNQQAENLTMSSGGQIPYNSANFVTAFDDGMYENELECMVGKDGMLMLGIKNELSGFGFQPYIAYDNFRLYRKCGLAEDETSKIDLYDLHAEAGEYVAVCMPYVVKSEYFGQVYRVGQIKEGQAVLVAANAVGVGEPCIIKATGESKVSAEVVTPVYTAPKTAFSLWDNTMITCDFNKLTWTATDADDAEVNLSELTYVEADLSQMDFTCTIENYAAARFWAENPDYTADGTSTVSQYTSLPAYNRTDQPNPVRIPIVASAEDQTLSYCQNEDMTGACTITVPAGESVADIYNLMPGTTYHYTTADGKSAGKFTVGGQLRMVMVGDNAVNMRDLGGKQVDDGGTVKYMRYGKIFRNAEFKGNSYNITDAEREILTNLNIGAEIDLRNTDGNRPWLKNATRDDNYYWAEYKYIIANGLGKMYEAATISNLKKEFEFIVSNLRKGVAVDIHCRIGADRTGFLCFMLEGLLGVNESDLMKDYETTSFSAAGLRTIDSGDDDVNAGTYKEKFGDEFRSKIPEGGTLRDVFENYFTATLDVDIALIREFRSIMLGDSPLPDMEADEIRLQQTKENAKTEVQGLVEGIENLAFDFDNYVESIDGARNATIAILIRDEAKNTISSYKYVTLGDKKYMLDENNGEYVLNSTESIVFTDKAKYESDCDFYAVSGLAYSRSFTNTTGVWQAWFVPFDVTVSDMNTAGMEVAEIAGVLMDGNKQPYIAFAKMTDIDAIVKANTPYVVKAQNPKVNMQLVGPDICIRKSTDAELEAQRLTVQSSYDTFTFGGNYQPTNGYENNWYALNKSGVFQKMGEGASLAPQRFWMQIDTRTDTPYYTGGSAAAKAFVNFTVFGDYEPTGIESLTPSESKGVIYNIQGQKVTRIQSGQVYIMNGKKFFAK